PTFTKDTSDRNRTSPFAFTGNKFEFRMVGSAQNVAFPNVVLNTAVAESFRQFADVLEGAENFDEALSALIKDTFTKHRRIFFNGNGYSEEWEREAVSRGLSSLKTCVDAFKVFTNEKNVALFATHGVMSEVEMHSREEIMFENYAKVINIEAQTMIDMTAREIIPAVNAYTAEVAATAAAKTAVLSDADIVTETDILKKLSALTHEAYDQMQALREAVLAARRAPMGEVMAESFRDNVLPLMEELRRVVDEMETLTAADFWPMPTYGDMLFSV
ncbi:MAG: glutamine synthetase type III, partial [Clostridia bacterium]|nr:glutamine synthetase type III [Clostridia bacterium]